MATAIKRSPSTSRRRPRAPAELCSAMPTIHVHTQRVRLTLGVADRADPPVGETVLSATSAAAVARAAIGREVTECVLVIFLDARRRVTGYSEVARGTINAARLTPRDVLTPACLACAAAICVAHNHPTGIATPSRADREVTIALRDAARLMGITLVDHLIVTPSGHYSFAGDEQWEPPA